MLTVILLIIVHWYLSLFCQTFYLHRYSAHRMFELSKFWEKFFYLLTYLCQGPSFLNPKAYSILHQRHHTHSDTQQDPHSPQFHSSVISMMLKTYSQYQKIKHMQPEEFESSVKKHYPQWRVVDYFSEKRIFKILWCGMYLGLYIIIAPPWYGYLFFPIHFIMGPIQGAIVNWCGHKIGYRTYELPDNSFNTFPLDLLLIGELYQNNHHRYVNDLNFAKKWFEVDIAYHIIQGLKLLGVVKKSKC